MATAAQAAREIPGKSLFRIGEVSRLTSTKTFVLRFWESEFPTLQPVKSPSGHRLYRREDIETVFEIKRLLYDEGFTIAGARRHLAEQHGSGAENSGISAAAGEQTSEEASSGSLSGTLPGSAPVGAARPAINRIGKQLLLELREELQAALTLLKHE